MKYEIHPGRGGECHVKYLDIAKGIAICLVVLQHTSYVPTMFACWYQSFYMSLFFVVSGILYNKTVITKDYVLKKARTLIVPYLIWNVFFMSVYFGLRFIILGEFNMDNLIRQILSVCGTFEELPDLSDVTWFLVVMFETTILFGLVKKFTDYIDSLFKVRSLVRNKIILVMICVVSTMISMYIISHTSYRLPYKILTSFVMLSVFLFGYLIKNNMIIKHKWIIPLFVVHICFVYKLNIPISVAADTYGNPIVFLFGAILGSVICLNVSKIMELKFKCVTEFFSWCGLNSIYILILHKPLCVVGIHVVRYFLNVDNSYRNLGIAILISCIIFCIMIPMIKVLKKIPKLSILFGR